MRRLAWAIVVASAGLVVIDTVVSAQYRTLFSTEILSEHAWPAVPVAALASVVMGALIVSRYPRHPIGWLLAAGGAATTLSLALEAVSLWLTDHDGPGSVATGRTLGWLSLVVNASFTLTTLALIFLIAPDGRLPSPRWRTVAWGAVAGYVLYAAGVLVIDPQEVRLVADQEYGLLTGVLTTVGILLTTLSLVASLVSLVRRMRRAVGVERQQLRWVVASAALPALALVFVLVGSAVWGSDDYLVNVPLYLSYLAVPICIAVAVLHHRLFDLDLIISRALLLAIATVMVGTGYVLVVVALSSAIGRETGGFWASLLAFVLVAMAFQPLRRRVVHLADRLAFGASATPYEALADLARRLGESPDPTYLLPAVAEAAGTAVSARRTTVRLRVPGAADQVGRWPAAGAAAAVVRPDGAEGGAGDPGPSGATVDIPVIDRGETLGTLHVEMPPGRDLRQHDSRLLLDLADQSALGFRNARLSAELAHQVAQLDRRTEELVESRRRLITAGDAERQRLERAIAREVVPHLEPLPARLQELVGSAEAMSLDPGAVQPLVAGSTAALEALREITRGVFPALLARAGLEAALRSLLGRAGGHLVSDEAPDDRLDERVEAAAYFCVAEVLRELSPPVEVVLAHRAAGLVLEVRAPDTGGLPPVAPLRDRVETVGGTVVGRTGEGLTVLEVRLPAAPRVEVPA